MSFDASQKKSEERHSWPTTGRSYPPRKGQKRINKQRLQKAVSAAKKGDTPPWR